MSGSFTTSYNVGGDIDKVKKVNEVAKLGEIGKLDEIGKLSEIGKLNQVGKLDTVGIINSIVNLQGVDSIKKLDEIGKIRGFATKTQPYNFMKEFNVPALKGDNIFTMDLPDSECEILAISLTCSGYGEDDHYDLFFNDKKWFEDWYCSEVKEGLFLGTSTYVYAAPANSKIKLVFKNDSATTKKIWLGVRMLVE